jgi:hypothetical protein
MINASGRPLLRSCPPIPPRACASCCSSCNCIAPALPPPQGRHQPPLHQQKKLQNELLFSFKPSIKQPRKRPLRCFAPVLSLPASDPSVAQHYSRTVAKPVPLFLVVLTLLPQFFFVNLLTAARRQPSYCHAPTNNIAPCFLAVAGFVVNAGSRFPLCSRTRGW